MDKLSPPTSWDCSTKGAVDPLQMTSSSRIRKICERKQKTAAILVYQEMLLYYKVNSYINAYLWQCGLISFATAC